MQPFARNLGLTEIIQRYQTLIKNKRTHTHTYTHLHAHTLSDINVQLINYYFIPKVCTILQKHINIYISKYLITSRVKRVQTKFRIIKKNVQKKNLYNVLYKE